MDLAIFFISALPTAPLDFMFPDENWNEVNLKIRVHPDDNDREVRDQFFFDCFVTFEDLSGLGVPKKLEIRSSPELSKMTNRNFTLQK